MSAGKKGKILVAMSGGVDSSVAAALLVRSGYNVTGVYFVNYNGQVPGGESCWHGDYQDALRVAAQLGIPLLRLDFVCEYQKFVLNYLYKEYATGRTPNPDVMCNKFIKFGFWLKAARKLGFDRLATGHYAIIAKRRGLFKLLTAKDIDKDQTYFLHQLNQEQLRQILFPIGIYTKNEVRKMAHKLNLATATKAESMGICFIGEVRMREFLKGKVKAVVGDIVNTAGKIVGQHQGLPFYTFGERGLCLQKGDGRPYFVCGKDIKNNRLIVGLADDVALFTSQIKLKNFNWLSGQIPKFPLQCQVRLRHRQVLQAAKFRVNCHRGNKVFFVDFASPQRAVTPGQFAVLYQHGECLGGGEIV